MRLLALLAGYIASLLAAVLAFRLVDGSSEANFAAILLAGVAIGYGFSRVPAFSRSRNIVATSAFLAALTMWVPVVIVTYGFALIGVPLLGLYSLAVMLGWKLARDDQAQAAGENR